MIQNVLEYLPEVEKTLGEIFFSNHLKFKIELGWCAEPEFFLTFIQQVEFSISKSPLKIVKQDLVLTTKEQFWLIVIDRSQEHF